MSYTPPSGNAVSFNLESGYTPPAGNAVNFDLSAGGGPTTTIVFPILFETMAVLAVPTISWFAQLAPLETLSELTAPDVVLSVSFEAFECQSKLTATTMRRVRLQPLESSGQLYVRDIFVAPENTTVVGPWPFETSSSLAKPDTGISIPVIFKTTSVLAKPLIVAAGSATVDVEPFVSASEIKADIQYSIIAEPFESGSELSVLAIKTMPAGDLYLETVPFNTTGQIAVPVIVQIIDTMELTSISELAVPDIFFGTLVACAPFETSSDLTAVMYNTLGLEPLISQSELTADIVIIVVLPTFETAGAFSDITIYSGLFKVLEPFVTTSQIRLDIEPIISPPVFVSESELSVFAIIKAVALGPLQSTSVLSVSDIRTYVLELADIYYFFTLTGDENSTTDLEVPISSFQCRMRNGEPTYLSVVIPGTDHAAEIAARPDGTLQVSMAYKQGSQLIRKEVIVSAGLSGIRIDEGPKNKSITLTGYKTETFTQKTVNLTGEVYKSTVDGKIRYRLAKSHIDLAPGDTVNIGDDSFVAGLISYYFRATKNGVSQNMEIAEA